MEKPQRCKHSSITGSLPPMPILGAESANNIIALSFSILSAEDRALIDKKRWYRHSQCCRRAPDPGEKSVACIRHHMWQVATTSGLHISLSLDP